MDENNSAARKQEPQNGDELFNKLLATGDNVDDALNLLFQDSSSSTKPATSASQVKGGRRKRGICRYLTVYACSTELICYFKLIWN